MKILKIIVDELPKNCNECLLNNGLISMCDSGTTVTISSTGETNVVTKKCMLEKVKENNQESFDWRENYR